MSTLLQQVILGLANGAIYSGMALALVLIYKGTHVLNVAQGEMALLSAYGAWQLQDIAIPFLLACALAIGGAFLAGVGLRYLVAPVQRRGGDTGVLIVTLGVFIGSNSVVGWVWGHEPLALPSPFPRRVFVLGDVAISSHQVGMIMVIAVVVVGVSVFFKYTDLGLRIRAAAENPGSATLSGVPVGAMLAIGWGLASAVGAIAAILIAHTVFLTPPMMFGVLIYAVASAILGGFDSPAGAIVGGLIVGQLESLSSFYIDFIGNDLKIVAAIAVIVAVLMVRPQGLFGTPEVNRL